MPQAVLDIVASASHFEHLPYNVDQRSSRISALLMLMLLLPALGALLVPLALLAAFPLSALAIALSKPLAAALVVLGLGVLSVLFLLPAARLVRRFGSGRSVRIEAGRVNVTDRGLISSRSWSAPTAEFRGLAHHVRASLSGVRHELILVHPERDKSVLIYVADKVSKATIERATALLRVPEVPARELYRRSQRRVWQPAIATPSVLAEAQAA
jgi:hypothetical protein